MKSMALLLITLFVAVCSASQLVLPDDEKPSRVVSFPSQEEENDALLQSSIVPAPTNILPLGLNNMEQNLPEDALPSNNNNTNNDPAPSPSVIFYNQAWVVAHFMVRYTDASGKNYSLQTSDVTIYKNRQVDIPAEATNIVVAGTYSKLYSWVTLFEEALSEPPLPPDNCYMITGTLFHMGWNKNCLILNDSANAGLEDDEWSEARDGTHPQLRATRFTTDELLQTQTT